MRVVFFSHSAGLYGAERSLLDIILELRYLGVNPLVILPKYGLLTEELDENNVEYVVIRYYGWIGGKHKAIMGWYRYLVGNVSARRLAKILRKEKVDLVYTNTLAISIGAMVAKNLGVKHVWHIREFIHEDMGAEFDFGARWASSFVTRNSSYIIYNSLAVKEKFSSLFGDVPNEVVYNGWLPEELNNCVERRPLSSEMPIKLCVVGSLHRGKGQHEAISALYALMDKFPRMTLNIVGSGDEAYIEELRELCSKYKLSKNIFFSGFLSSTSDIFKQSDISIVCSRNEAFGRVVVESMAEGCPVVAACSGGIPEIIRHGENGLMYDSEDPGDLVRQVTVLVNDTKLYSNIVEKGIKDAYKRFGRKKQGENVCRIINRLG